jgi:TolB protein
MRRLGSTSVGAFVFLTMTVVAGCNRRGEPEGQGTPEESAHSQVPGLPEADLVFSSNRSGDSEIYLLPAGSSDWINLTNHPGGDNWPVWSPDGSRIAFQSDRGGSLDVWVMAADGSDLHQLTTDPEPDYLPVWSPDGSQLSFASWRREPGDTIRANHIYLMNADGTEQVRLFPESPGTSADASWAPDGSGWVLSRKVGGEPTDVFILDDSGAEIGRLTEDDASNGTAAFSPDGTRIAYYADRGDVSELVIAASDGSEPRTLLGQGLNYYPRWSPDGRWIVFTAAAAPGQTDDLEVMAIPADGSGPPVTLAGGPGREAEGRWRPSRGGSSPRP